jgi:hypothetical protein
MSIDWESIFSAWAQPPGKTEQERCENAESAIRNAIASSNKLKHRNIKVFTQGSYRNRVNVRKDSDVDVGILCFDTFNPSYPEGIDAKSLGHSDATYHYSVFKNEVEEALVNYFGSRAVHRGTKAFDIHENTYHVEADVTPFFEHRRYTSRTNYLSGVILYPDDGGQIINWPEQHYENGVTKNTATSRSYKGVVRILKSLRNLMDTADISPAKPIVGFFIECLVWNIPNASFGHDTWDKDVQKTLLFLWSNTKSYELCSEWGEVSELKYIFKGSASSKREQAYAFIDAAWSYVGVR